MNPVWTDGILINLSDADTELADSDSKAVGFVLPDVQAKSARP